MKLSDALSARTLVIALPLTLVLAACGMKTVPDSALVEIPPSQMSAVSAASQSLQASEVTLVNAEKDYKRAKRRVAVTRKALKKATRRADKASDRKLDALDRDDSPAMAGAHADLERARQERRDASKAHSEATVRMINAEQDLAIAEARVEANHTELELLRAKAAQAGGADVNIEAYAKQNRKAEAKLAQIKRRAAKDDSGA